MSADLAMPDEGIGRFDGEHEQAPIHRRGRPRRRLLKWTAGLLVALLVGLAVMTAFLDTGPGHRFIANRIAALAPGSGLRIRIGRIDGTIWGGTRLTDVRLYDPQGLFAESPRIDIDWQPLGWLTSRLLIDRLEADLVILHRPPKLKPSAQPGPILPSFDIRIGRLAIEQLRFEPAWTGQRRAARVLGTADIRSGRALVDLKADVRGGGDRLALLLDVEPDRNRFDVDVRLQSPEGGVAGAIFGTRRPISLQVEGDGSWTAWAGNARLDLSGRRTAELSLSAREGDYNVTGALAPAQFWTGKKARLTAPRVLLNARATFRDRRLDGALSLRSSALKVETKGAIDLAASRFDDVRIGVDLLRPQALFPNMSGRSVRLTALLDGAFRGFAFAYRLTSPRVAFDNTGFEDVKAEGRGRWSKAPVSVPILLTARRVAGVGDVAGGILANLRVTGVLKVTDKRLTGDDLVITSDKLKGRGSLFVDLVTGRYDVVLSGGLTRYLIPGLGIVDVLTELKVVPNPGARGTLVTGKGRAWVRRFDNRFLLGLAGGLPQLETDLVRTNDGIIRFSNLRIVAPAMRIQGAGLRRRDGTFQFEGSGRQATYGPFAMTLDGRIERPKLAIRLQSPNATMGLANVLLLLDPSATGFAYRAEGGSTLGPFTSRGEILLPPGQPATIRVAALNVSGTSAAGALRSDPGGFTGRLDVAGGGLGGALLFNPVGEVQRIEAHLTAEDARFLGPPPIAIRRGKMDGVILLNPGATSVEGTLSLRGMTRGPLSLARLDAQASLRGGVGQV